MGADVTFVETKNQRPSMGNEKQKRGKPEDYVWDYQLPEIKNEGPIGNL